MEPMIRRAGHADGPAIARLRELASVPLTFSWCVAAATLASVGLDVF
jgi:hypothetical protein